MNKWVLNIFMLIHFMYEKWGVDNPLNKAIFYDSFYLLAAYFCIIEYRKDKNYLYLMWGLLWVWWAIAKTLNVLKSVPISDYFYIMVAPLVILTIKDFVCKALKTLKT